MSQYAFQMDDTIGNSSPNSNSNPVHANVNENRISKMSRRYWRNVAQFFDTRCARLLEVRGDSRFSFVEHRASNELLLFRNVVMYLARIELDYLMEKSSWMYYITRIAIQDCTHSYDLFIMYVRVCM